MSLRGACPSLARKVRRCFYSRFILEDAKPIPVTDMLIAILNCCSKEELDEESDEEVYEEVTETGEDGVERRQVIKNKILAVGRMARVFALLRFVICTFIYKTYMLTTCSERNLKGCRN